MPRVDPRAACAYDVYIRKTATRCFQSVVSLKKMHPIFCNLDFRVLFGVPKAGVRLSLIQFAGIVAESSTAVKTKSANDGGIG